MRALSRSLHMRSCSPAAYSLADMGAGLEQAGPGDMLVSAAVHWLQLLCGRHLFVRECLGRASRGLQEIRQAQHCDHCISNASRLCAVLSGFKGCMQSKAMLVLRSSVRAGSGVMTCPLSAIDYN